MNWEDLELIHLPTYLPERISITILKPLSLPVSSIFRPNYSSVEPEWGFHSRRFETTNCISTTSHRSIPKLSVSQYSIHISLKLRPTHKNASTLLTVQSQAQLTQFQFGKWFAKSQINRFESLRPVAKTLEHKSAPQRNFFGQNANSLLGPPAISLLRWVYTLILSFTTRIVWNCNFDCGQC